MEVRPKIDVPQTSADKASELFAWAALALLWALTLWNFSRMPATIPIHFNAVGSPDHYGDKSSLLMLPLVASVLFAAITVLSKFPHILNYPTEITSDNALRQYRNAIRLLRGLKTVLVLVFLLLVFKTGQTAAGQASGLGVWFLPLVMGLLLVLPVVFYLSSLANPRD